MMDIQKILEQSNARLDRAEARQQQAYDRLQQRKTAKLKREAKCGAFARSTGKPCQAKPLANGRCRNHGGKSTGPKTPEGKKKALMNLKQYQSSG